MLNTRVHNELKPVVRFNKLLISVALNKALIIKK